MEKHVFTEPLKHQICIVRSGLALFEFTADRGLLKQLLEWCRFLEAKWDTFENDFCVRIQSADLS